MSITPTKGFCVADTKHSVATSKDTYELDSFLSILKDAAFNTATKDSLQGNAR